MSVNWYAQLETGHNDAISPAALDSVAQALKLSERERLYLGALAHVPLPAARQSDPVGVPERLVAFLSEISDRPAVIWNRRRDAVAWNAMTASILHSTRRRSTAMAGGASLSILIDGASGTIGNRPRDAQLQRYGGNSRANPRWYTTCSSICERMNRSETCGKATAT
jgi:hypothetical protein